MYSLYLDASGTHGASPVYILAGVAVHEQDAYHLQQRFAAPLSKLPGGPDPRDYELHATEMVSPRLETSMWRGVPVGTRMSILHASYRALETYKCVDAEHQYAFFGAVVERTYGDYEQRAWHEVLHRFDEMLTRRGHEAGGQHQRGIAIHDRSSTERRVQNWADRWRLIESRIGVLTHMADVPFFADSRASRLLQAADFVSWALWRHYGLPSPDSRWIQPLWSHFDQADGKMHGLIHASRSFPAGKCTCPPCVSRAA
jgi:Protein of unknown function (DUF3800)